MLKIDNICFSFIFLLIILINGCDNGATGNIVHEGINENDVNLSAYFCPKHDCEAAIIKSIDNAKKSAHCAFYDLDLNDLISAIAKKSNSADVKIIIDTENYDGQIKGDGIKIAKTNAKMHNKFCVIDDNLVLTGSTNPTNNDAHKNNNNLIMINSDYIAENYEDEFQELWRGIFKKGTAVKDPEITLSGIKIENYFCPDDHCIQQVVEELKTAEESIYFMAFSFTSEEIADVLLIKNLDEIPVKGVMETRQISEYSQFERLKNNGVEVIKDLNPHNMHHKVFIIDGQTVITGSFNPTNGGDKRNDENMLIIHDEEIAQRFIREFQMLFNVFPEGR